MNRWIWNREKVRRRYLLKSEMWNIKGANENTFFDVNSLSKLLDECGFRNVKIDTIFYTEQGNKIELLIAKVEK